MSETIRLQLQHLLHPPSAEPVRPAAQEYERRNVHIEQLAALTREAIQAGATEELNDVLHELEQSKEAEIRSLCEDRNNPLFQVAQPLSQVSGQAREIKSTIAIVGQQIERSSNQLIEKVSRHVHMKRTRLNIEESLKIVRLCLVALEHTNQVQELLKSDHKVAAVQNLQDLQSMELNELRHLGMGALISRSLTNLTSDITAATLASLSDFFESRALKNHIEDVGERASKLMEAQRAAWDMHVQKHRHLRAFQFNSIVELAYRRSNSNYLTESNLLVELGPLSEAEMVFKKLGRVSELQNFIESRFSRFSDELAVSDIEKLLDSTNKIVGFCLFDRICSSYLPASRPSKLVDDTWEKLGQNLSGVIGASLNTMEDYRVLQKRLGIIMNTLQNFDFNVAIISDLLRSLLIKIVNQTVDRAKAEFNSHWRTGDHMQLVITTQESLESVMNVAWYDPSKYEDTQDSNELPKAMPFSEIYIVVCRYLRLLIQHGNSFLEFFQQDPGFVENTVSGAIDSFLRAPVCSQLSAVANGENRELMVQTLIDLQLFYSAATNIEKTLARFRGATGRRGTVSLESKAMLERAIKQMETRIHVLVEETVRELVSNGFDWTAEEPSSSPSSTILEMTAYMLTMTNTILKRLPPQTRELTYFTLTENISAAMCSSLYEIPAGFTVTGLNNFETDLQFLETSIQEAQVQQTSTNTLEEAKQIVMLLRSAEPEKELSDPTVRNRKYGQIAQNQASQLVQKLKRRSVAGQSPKPDAKQQNGFMRYLAGEK